MAVTQITPAVSPMPWPTMKPARRPIRRMSMDAGMVEIMTKTICRANGTVARLLSAASMYPARGDTVPMMATPDMANARLSASRMTFLRDGSGEISEALFVVSVTVLSQPRPCLRQSDERGAARRWRRRLREPAR